MVLPSPQTQALLDSIYNQTLVRTYINPLGYRIMLSVAWGRPVRCHPGPPARGVLPGAGASDHRQRGGANQAAGPPVPVRYLMSRFGSRNEPITYWLVVGDQVTVSRTDQKLAQFRLGLKGYIPDGMLVRVSSIDNSPGHGYQQQEAFLRDLAQSGSAGWTR